MRVLLVVSLVLFVFCSMVNVASGRSFWEVIDGISKKQAQPYCPEQQIDCDNGDSDCIGKWGCNGKLISVNKCNILNNLNNKILNYYRLLDYLTN